VIVRERVEKWVSFLKQGCAIEEFWKTGLDVGLYDSFFPPIAQEAQIGLWKRVGLCE